MRKMILLAFAALAAASCTRGLDEAAVRGGDEIRFVVGDFPAFGGSETRAVGTEDPGKTEWAKGDELLLEMTSTTLGTKYATFKYNGSEWKLTDGELAYKEDEYPTFPHLYYAPDYKWVSGKLALKDGKVAGTDEFIEGTAQITSNGEAITVSFNATREYSRLRIATIPDVDVSVSVEYFTPAGSTSYVSTYTLHSDAKGNAYLYGGFVNNSTVSVKYDNVVLADYSFTQATVNGTSYVLDATVVSLEGMSSEEIDAVVQNIASEVYAGKTRFNIRLAADAGEEVFAGIHSGLMEAGYRSIDLTLIGCEKIPAEAFMSWTMLKSVTLPDVTEIGKSAFLGCSWLEKVVFGTPLKEVYGDPESSYYPEGGIFAGCSTDMIDLVLSGEQNMMASKLVDGEFVQIAQDGQPYKGCSDHYYHKFIGYTFKSVTCGDDTH